MIIERVNSKPARWTTLVGLILVPVLIAGGLGVIARSLRAVGGGDGDGASKPPPS